MRLGIAAVAAALAAIPVMAAALAGSALAETTTDIRYYPATTPLESGGEGYSFYIMTDDKEKPDSPEAQLVLSCSALADGVSFELMGTAALALPVTASDPEQPGELFPARFSAQGYDATVTLDWVRWDAQDVDGVFTSNDELYAFEQAVVSATKLRAEAFGHAYTFDLASIAADIAKYLQGCFELTPGEPAPGGD